MRKHLYYSKQLISSGALGHALPFNNSSTTSIAPVITSIMTIWGPASQPTRGGSMSYVLFIDEFTRCTWLYLINNKSGF